MLDEIEGLTQSYRAAGLVRHPGVVDELGLETVPGKAAFVDVQETPVAEIARTGDEEDQSGPRTEALEDQRRRHAFCPTNLSGRPMPAPVSGAVVLGVIGLACTETAIDSRAPVA